ncbi:hypothetical protein [Polyangium aurulentum]|uniref:hypothetical protein n=1 Tax=Polyangium aurulentum TaxID=2567896 RepID=UPI0010AE0704|nr:hypothetical protein [Polyangium aurulentum]UQA62621.1 hypothetical protein E8A73_020060 [Polyangium aurulentum]
MRFSILTATFVAQLVVSSVVFGGDATLGEDEISLKDGGMLRGTIVAIEPNKEATIVVNGKQRTIRWSKIDKVERGKYKSESKPAPPKDEDEDEDESSAQEGEPEQGAPRLFIESNYEGVELRHIERTLSVVTSRGMATGVMVRTACAAPCGRVIDGTDGSQFFFSAPGMVGSSAFSLSDKSGDVTARVRGGSAGKRLGGFLGVAIGGAAILGGLSMLLVSSIVPSGDDYQVPSFVVLGVGAAGVGVGAYLLATSGTKVEFLPRTPKSAGVRFEDGRLLF